MFKPNYKITNQIVNYLTKIAEARSVILNASLVPKWEISLRQEAILKNTHASTSIEGNSLSLEEVSDLMIGRDVTALKKDKQEVLNYFEALKYLNNLNSDKKKHLTNKDILKLHQIITKDTLENSSYCGQYRTGKQYVIVGNRRTGKVSFRPPATKEVPKLMDDLLSWINSNFENNSINHVVQAGIGHYEFVRIHPFIDGNGRTARVLATLILIRNDFDIKRFFALDDFYNSDRPRYYQTLKNVNQQTLDLTEWLKYFCEGVYVSIKAVQDKAILLTGGKKKFKNKEQIVIDNRQIKIVESIKRYGKITNRETRDLLKISNKTAYNWLKFLVKHNVIKKVGRGRSIFYVLR